MAQGVKRLNFTNEFRKCAEFVRANLKTVNDVEKSAKPAIDWGDLKFYRLPHSVSF